MMYDELSLMYLSSYSAAVSACCSIEDDEVSDNTILSFLRSAVYNISDFLITRKGKEVPESCAERIEKVNRMYGASYVPKECKWVCDKDTKLDRNQLGVVSRVIEFWVKQQRRTYGSQLKCDCSRVSAYVFAS